jgi:hypothetical protein
MKIDLLTGLKICSRCKVSKAPEHFYRSSKEPDGLREACKKCIDAQNNKYRKNLPRSCRNQRRRRYIYGLTPKMEASLKEAQQHKCPGCLRDLSSVKVHVDHDHISGRVRGLLCFSCNVSLGHLNDDPEILQRLMDYLRGLQ